MKKRGGKSRRLDHPKSPSKAPSKSPSKAQAQLKHHQKAQAKQKKPKHAHASSQEEEQQSAAAKVEDLTKPVYDGTLTQHILVKGVRTTDGASQEQTDTNVTPAVPTP
jgi:hypothetical protein